MEAQFTASMVIETFLVLLTGTLAIVFLIAALATRVRSATWRRTLWQVSTLAMLLLVVGETLGLGVAVAHSVHAVFSRARQLAVREASHPQFSRAAADRPAAVETQDCRTAVEDDFSSVASTSPMFEADPDDPLDTSATVLAVKPAAAGPARNVRVLRWDVWLLAVWCTGCVAMASRLVWGRLRLWLLTRRSRSVGQPRWPASVQQLASQLGVSRRLRVIESDWFPTPVTFGVLHPTIVLPAGFSTQYDQRQQRAVLAHEVAHLAAWDALWLCLADAACVMLWWHRLSWWSRAKLREACESEADEGSLVIPGGPETLAECLVVMGRRLTDRRELAWLSIQGSHFHSHLGRRVEHLLTLARNLPPTTGRCPHALTKLALVTVLVLTTFLTTTWVRSQAALDRGELNMNVLKLSWRRSLAAAIVVPFLVSLSQDTRAADSTGDAPATTVAVQEPSQETAQATEGQRVQGAIKELEERAAAIEGQLRELGDRHPDKAEELKRELNGIQERMQQLRGREGAQEPQGVEGAMRELQERISATERQLREVGGEQTDKGAALHRELNGMQERMQQLRRRSAAGEQQQAQGAMRELRERAAAVEGELRELGDGHPDKAEALKQELNGIRARMQELRQRGASGDRGVPQGAIRELRERAAVLEQELRELGDNHPDRAEAIKQELTALRERAQRVYSEGGRVVPQPDYIPQRRAEESSTTSREIEELRGQVQEMRKEMEALRAEVRRLVEREGRERN